MTNSLSSARATAHSNIALAKYWGKADIGRNMPAVPSLSMTLSGMFTETVVTFDPRLANDELHLNGRQASDKELVRVVRGLDLVRQEAGRDSRARVHSRNNFPTASGLASSASGFAALVLAARAACNLPDDRALSSAFARQCSASAARSVFGGFVALPLGAESAVRLTVPASLDVELLVAVTAEEAKSVGSTEGMVHTRDTSPYYAAWVQHAPELYERAVSALTTGDLATLGPLVEQSTLLMHASMFGAGPAIIYWSDVTLRVIHAVRKLRADGLTGYFTMDAGPHVKVLVQREQADTLSDALSALPGVKRVIRCNVGPDARIESGVDHLSEPSP
jgi:diphosphomevalonate decarboxylase